MDFHKNNGGEYLSNILIFLFSQDYFFIYLIPVNFLEPELIQRKLSLRSFTVLLIFEDIFSNIILS